MLQTEQGGNLNQESGGTLLLESEESMPVPNFQIGIVPIKEAADPTVAGTVQIWLTDAGAGVVPVHTVVSFEAGVVPVEIVDDPGIGIVPVFDTDA
jgi:hypothetical protein